MSNLSRKLMMGASGSLGEKLYIESLFSTYLYTGTSSTQTITNGIDLSGEGGLVWIKGRSNAENHTLFDSERPDKSLASNLADAEANNSAITFLSSGFQNDGTNFNTINDNGVTYASWTFRKAPGFFDVVTWTGNGNGSPDVISHNLGSTPGTIIVKRTDTTSNWLVWHRSLSNSLTSFLYLNSSVDEQNATGVWGDNAPTSTQFEFQDTTNGSTWVAYLFAHDEQIFGVAGDQSVIKCGSFTTDGSGAATVNLGWEPQWLLVKRTATAGGSWYIFDSMRGIVTPGNDTRLLADATNSELNNVDIVDLTATGFLIKNEVASEPYIYIAIRRGPMKTPTSATEVFKADETAGSTRFSTGFAAVDLSIQKRQDLAGTQWFWASRLTGNTNALSSDSTAAEAATSSGAWEFDLSGQYEQNYVINPIMYLLRRAPGFFDVVAYTGTGGVAQVPHNLGVKPDFIIAKSRTSGTANWWTTHINNNSNLALNTNAASGTYANSLSRASSTDTTFLVTDTLGVNSANYTGHSYIAYLFGSLAGVSKCGGYTGTGTTLDIDCGFTSGARFVMIKRTDTQINGQTYDTDWYVWDTARGIIAGNDPYLTLNETAQEVTGTDFIDPLSSGFQISSTAPAAINANGGTFIFLAIA